MAYNSDEGEMVPEGIVEVARAIVGFHVPVIYVSGQVGANSYTEYGLVEVKRLKAKKRQDQFSNPY